jgi:pre-mRNA 3'-end-processing factor FIP1
MPEDQLTVLPPEVRQMVMTGTTAMMNGAGNPGMMGQGMMMDMGMMGPMGMGMNGDMGMGGPMMQVDGRMMGMQDGGHPGQIGNGTPEQQGMQDGFGGMGMEYAAQVCPRSVL